MAKLYFRYGPMSSSKSSALLQVAHNYKEQGQRAQLYTSHIDDRYGRGKITSRIGISADAEVYTPETDFYKLLTSSFHPNLAVLKEPAPACILIDEAQFLTDAQVRQLHRVAHLLGVPVICYGLRSDFQGKSFEGSHALLTLADSLEELKTVCRCGKKATMNVRIDENGNRVLDGDQVEIGGDSRYTSVCPTRFYTGRCGFLKMTILSNSRTE